MFFAGDTVSKVGMVTGWTRGAVVASSGFVVGSDGLYRLENWIVAAASDSGDSGAPVIANSLQQLVGIQWGKSTLSGQPVFLFSAWENVSLDLTGSAYELHATAPKLLGHEFWRVYPDDCPSHPDVQDVFIVYGWITNENYETDYRSYAGRTGHYCEAGYVDETYSQSAPWQACMAFYSYLPECPCADAISARDTNCPFRGP